VITKAISNFAIVRIAALILMILPLLAACTSYTVGPATATARAQRVIAQATDVAQQLRTARVLDETQATATAKDRLDRLAQVSEWPVILSDAFDDNSREWVVGNQTSTYADAAFTIANGVFHWEATSHQGFVWWNHPTIVQATDFHLAVDYRQLSGPSDAYIGLVMRLDENGDYYLFSLDNAGNYSFDVYSNGQWLSLIPWTPSPAIRVSQINHVEAVGEGGLFSLFVNGEWVVDHEDQTISSGYSGLLAGMSEVGESAAWEFDNFELRGIQGTDATPATEATSQP